MDKFNKLYKQLISEMTEIEETAINENDLTWIYRVTDATGNQIGEDLPGGTFEKDIIAKLEPGKPGDKLIVYEIGFDKEGNQKRKRKHLILLWKNNAWIKLWSKLDSEVARERERDRRRDELQPTYRKWEPKGDLNFKWGWNAKRRQLIPLKIKIKAT